MSFLISFHPHTGSRTFVTRQLGLINESRSTVSCALNEIRRKYRRSHFRKFVTAGFYWFGVFLFESELPNKEREPTRACAPLGLDTCAVRRADSCVMMEVRTRTSRFLRCASDTQMAADTTQPDEIPTSDRRSDRSAPQQPFK